MQFVIDKSELAEALSIAARAVSTRSHLPALAGVKVTASGDQLCIESTDTEMGIRHLLTASISSEGVSVVPARLFSDVVKQMPTGELTATTSDDGSELSLESGEVAFKLRLLPADDFPQLPEVGGTTIQIPAAELVHTIERVARAASRDETRPHLTGILMSVAGDELKMVATDSYRLAFKTTKLSSPVAENFEANVPVKTLQEVVRLAAGVQSISVTIGERQIAFANERTTLVSRLVEGQFPDHEQLLPESFEHELSIDVEELLEAVKRVSLLAQKNTPLRLAFSEGELTVSAQAAEIGEAHDRLPITGFSGEPMEIGFNHEFLRDGLESVNTERATLKLISAFRPGLIESEDEGKFVYLVMPIRLNV